MATKTTKAIEIRPLELGFVEFDIVGTTPLIVHAWSHKAKQEMLDKQRGKKVTAKHDIKIPVRDFCDSLYWLTDQPEMGETDESAEEGWLNAISSNSRFGFPVTAIEQSIISGAWRAGLDVKQTEMRGTFFMSGATAHGTLDMAEILSSDGITIPEMREDMVKVGGMSKTADIRFRGQFNDWRIPVRLKYMKSGKYTLEQILNFVNYGGFVVGVGEWRPERDGQFGMYELDVSSVKVLS